MQRKDAFFEKQPPMRFVEELRTPIYTKAPGGFGKNCDPTGKVNVGGMFIASPCPDALLETSFASLERFTEVYGIKGESYPVEVLLTETEKKESFCALVSESGITITGDIEGLRRGLVWLEDEIRRNEGPYLAPGKTKRHAVIHSRITRSFFSPTNRPPKNGDELSDDVDYYPEEYLNRLMHDGSNGVWIYTRFSDLITSDYMPHWGEGRQHRAEKLNRLVEKCARYGIGVYVFAIEPIHLKSHEAEMHPELAGLKLGNIHDPNMSCVCIESDAGKDFVYKSGKALLESVPGLRGFISITFGERPTSCASCYPIDFESGCPHGKCPAKSHGQLLADNLEALRSGMRSVNPECETISWTYGQRLCSFDDIREYVRKAPLDVMLMQNFDDFGYEEQLGIMRQSIDYWLSYVGPSDFFTVTAREAVKTGHCIYAKMQVCCSHEIASVPYIPVPGILYKKYSAARKLGVEGVLQCWYFGNYPSIMSKAAGELAFEESFEDENAFLKKLAAIWYGYSKADTVVRAWKLFEEGYRRYPLNVMFGYYGPAHDSVIWKLRLLPANIKLPRSWWIIDPADGDRIGESLLCGHTLEEAIDLCDVMSKKWHEGTRVLERVSGETTEQLSVAKAIDLLFDSTRNILEFYLLREKLGYREGNPGNLLEKMETIVLDEIENSRKMIPLCEADGRLGYHSEAVGYKFFPEKLKDRISYLENLLKTEFEVVKNRVKDGLVPLEYYCGNKQEKHYNLAEDILSADWEPIGEKARFRAALTGDRLTLELSADTPTEFMICPEFRLMWPEVPVRVNKDGLCYMLWIEENYFSMFGEREKKMLERYNKKHSIKGNIHRYELNLRDFGVKMPHPFKMSIKAGGEKWVNASDPTMTLGFEELPPEEFGWFFPPER